MFNRLVSREARFLGAVLLSGGCVSCGGPAGPVAADPDGAETCARVKVWDSYAEDWALRSLSTHTLAPGEAKALDATLYAGNTYRFSACGDAGVGRVDVLLYDAEGEIIARSEPQGREPTLEFKPDVTRTVRAALYLRARNGGGKTPAAAALAITYK